MKQSISISLQEETIQKIKDLAERNGATFSGIVKLALNSYLDGGDKK